MKRPEVREWRSRGRPPRYARCPSHKNGREVITVPGGKRYVIGCPFCDATPKQRAKKWQRIMKLVRQDMAWARKRAFIGPRKSRTVARG